MAVMGAEQPPRRQDQLEHLFQLGQLDIGHPLHPQGLEDLAAHVHRFVDGLEEHFDHIHVHEEIRRQGAEHRGQQGSQAPHEQGLGGRHLFFHGIAHKKADEPQDHALGQSLERGQQHRHHTTGDQQAQDAPFQPVPPAAQDDGQGPQDADDDVQHRDVIPHQGEKDGHRRQDAGFHQ